MGACGVSTTLIGEKFGRLTVVDEVGKNKWGDRTWKCRCDCGNTLVVSGGHLKSGHTKSCGCLARELRVEKATVHGITSGGKRPRTMNVWRGMKARCFNPKAVSYPNYGARGITVCDEWLSFENFHNWAMANGYADDLQLDRIDNDGNYCPENCRWVTRSMNQRNTSRTHLMTINGKTQCASDWIKELGISKSTFYEALKKGEDYLIDRYCKA